MTTHRPAEPAPTTEPTGGTHRRWIYVAALAAILIAVAAIGAIAARSDDDGDSAAEPLVLSLGAGEGTASCLPFSEETLAAKPSAFAGTVTTIEPGAITLAVDRWYTGGDAAVVELTTVADAQALLGGFPLEVGSQYLITASDGAVDYCGYSGPATPELRSTFDAAFAG